MTNFAPMEEKNEIQSVESLIISLRGKEILLDRDVAELYGVTTRDINKAVKNNPDKFPEGYVFDLEISEKKELVENFHRLNSLKFSTTRPKAFTEKGLYMLATILKSKLATEVTISIIETFTQLRVIDRAIREVNARAENGENPSVQDVEKVQGMMTEVFENKLPLKIQKVTFGINLGVISFSAEISRKKK